MVPILAYIAIPTRQAIPLSLTVLASGSEYRPPLRERSKSRFDPRVTALAHPLILISEPSSAKLNSTVSENAIDVDARLD
jgi:hypothetical protein